MPGPSIVNRVLGTAGHVTRQVATTTAEVAKGTTNALVHPQQWPLLALEAGETARSVVRQLVGTNTARSPLWTERSLRRPAPATRWHTRLPSSRQEWQR